MSFQATPEVIPKAPRQFLFVESAPGRIERVYGFEDEETRIVKAVNVEEHRGLEFSKTEPFTNLQGKIASKAWDAIHVTGVDTHQAAWLIDDFYDEAARKVARRENVIDKSDRLHDGMISSRRP